MIIPSYSATATERVLPRLALDFTTGSLDPRVTVARALNTATRVNSSGLIELINADLPRFSYNPSTLVCQGLLIEETRTNLVINSSLAGTGGINPTSWTRLLGSDGAQATSTLATAGTSSAWEFTSANNRQIIYQTLSVAANTTYYASVYVESNTSALVNTQLFNVTNQPAGATVTYQASTTTAGSRLVISIQVGATAGTVQFRMGTGVSSNITGYARLSCPQLEAGSFATSYIPTTTTSVARNADAVGMTGTNFSDWFNATEGAFEAEYSSYVAANASNSKGILAATDGTTGNRLYMNINTAGVPFFFVSASSSTQANISTGVTLVNDAVVRTVAAYKLNSFAAATNGTSGTPDTLGNVPTVNRLDIGSLLTSPQLNGHFRKLMYWPQRITNAETQAFSK